MQVSKELNRGDALLELLLIDREELVEDVKANGSLGCTDCRMVKSKILKEVREASNRIVILVFRRAAFILLRELVGWVPGEAALKCKTAQVMWLVFKNDVHIAQQSIWMCRKLSRHSRRLTWMHRELLSELKYQEVYLS